MEFKRILIDPEGFFDLYLFGVVGLVVEFVVGLDIEGLEGRLDSAEYLADLKHTTSRY